METYIYSRLAQELQHELYLEPQKSKRVGPDHTPSLYSVGRNEFCPCGSGLKHKKCCINKKK